MKSSYIYFEDVFGIYLISKIHNCELCLDFRDLCRCKHICFVVIYVHVDWETCITYLSIASNNILCTHADTLQLIASLKRKVRKLFYIFFCLRIMVQLKQNVTFCKTIHSKALTINHILYILILIGIFQLLMYQLKWATSKEFRGAYTYVYFKSYFIQFNYNK